MKIIVNIRKECRICFCLMFVLFIIAIINSIFPSLTFLSFASCGMIQALATIGVSFMVKEYLDCDGIAKQLYNGDYLSVPAIMHGIQIMDKQLYDKVMSRYKHILESKIVDNQRIVDRVLEEARIALKTGTFKSFDIREERERIIHDNNSKELVKKIEDGEDSWENVYSRVMDNERYFAILKYLVGDSQNEPLVQKAIREAEEIIEMRNKGINITIGK